MQRPLVRQCGVCASPASIVLHFGAVACYSCRAFFRRMICSCKETSHVCAGGSDCCPIDSVNRTNCKKCRLQRCLEIGMRPEKVNMVEKHRGHTVVGVAKQGKQNSYLGDQSSTQSLTVEDRVKDMEEDRMDMDRLVEESFLEKTRPQSGITTSVIVLNPIFDLTLEEEFKIHELVARKELLQEAIFGLLYQVPLVKTLITTFILGGGKPQFGKIHQTHFRDGFEQIIQLMGRNLKVGGKIRNCLDLFDQYRNVDESVKTETFRFSLRILDICIGAFLRRNCDKPTIKDQHIASGIFSRRIEEMLFKNHNRSISLLPSFDPLEELDRFWSAGERPSDVEFLVTTLEKLGGLVREDIKLSTLYMTLILATPGTRLSATARTDPALLKVQKEMALLIFRYLRHNRRDSTQANTVTDALLRLVGDLHTSADILLLLRLAVAEQPRL